MNKYLRLFRLGNGIMGILGVVIGAFIAAGTGILDYSFNIAISCLLVIAFIAGGNSLNDYIDRDADKIGHPDRPLPLGEIEPKIALYCGISGLVLACLISFLMRSIETSAMVIAAAILMIAYEMTLKQKGFVGNITIAVMTGMLFLFGGSIVGNIWANTAICMMAITVSIGREIAKDIEDMNSDKEERLTLPMKIGVRKSTLLATVFYILGPVLSIYPLVTHTFGLLYCIVFVADAMFIYCAWLLFSNAHKSQKMAKLAMLVALVAFILGVIQ